MTVYRSRSIRCDACDRPATRETFTDDRPDEVTGYWCAEHDPVPPPEYTFGPILSAACGTWVTPSGEHAHDACDGTVRLPAPHDKCECHCHKTAAAIDHARTKGASDGAAAASWYFDGNTDRATYERVLVGIEEGDPEILDTFPCADLSGEWADGLTPRDLVRECIEAAGLHPLLEGVEPSDAEAALDDDICLAYETAFNESVEHAIQEAAHHHTS